MCSQMSEKSILGKARSDGIRTRSVSPVMIRSYFSKGMAPTLDCLQLVEYFIREEKDFN